jgi:hypothetical protein
MHRDAIICRMPWRIFRAPHIASHITCRPHSPRGAMFYFLYLIATIFDITTRKSTSYEGGPPAPSGGRSSQPAQAHQHQPPTTNHQPPMPPKPKPKPLSLSPPPLGLGPLVPPAAPLQPVCRSEARGDHLCFVCCPCGMSRSKVMCFTPDIALTELTIANIARPAVLLLGSPMPITAMPWGGGANNKSACGSRSVQILV